MKTKSISGNKAATPNTQSSSPCDKTNPHPGKAQLHFDYTSGPLINPEPQIQNPKSEDRWVTKPEVAAHLRISIRSVEKRMTEGLPYHPFGRSIRFLLSEVDAYARTVTLKIDTSRKKIDPRDATNQSIVLSGTAPQINVTNSRRLDKEQTK